MLLPQRIWTGDLGRSEARPPNRGTAFFPEAIRLLNSGGILSQASVARAIPTQLLSNLNYVNIFHCLTCFLVFINLNEYF